MKHFLMIAAMGLAAPFAASADDFSEFRIPEHKANRWDVSLTAHALGNKNSYADVNDHNTLGTAALFTSAFWLKDSDPLRRVIRVEGSAVAGGASQHGERPMFTDRTTGRDASQAWLASIEERRYPWAAPLGVEWVAVGSGDYQQQWRKEALTATNPPATTDVLRSDEEWTYHTAVQASAALGFGRVRDDTGVQDALILEQRLARSGVLSRPLSHGARNRLASLMYARGAFDAVADRPASYIWSTIDSIVRDDGAVGDGASDPGAWARAFEPYLGASGSHTGDLVPSSPLLRLTGIFIGPGVAYSQSDRRFRDRRTFNSQDAVDDSILDQSSITYGTDLHESASQTIGNLTAEWHRPLGLEWQADALAQYSTSLKDLDARRFVFTSSAQVAYLVADRWSGTLRADYDHREDPDLNSRWTVVAHGQLDFYMEDHLTFTLVASHQESRVTPYYNRLDGITISLSYRLAGGFSAPGLLTPTLGREITQ